MSRGFASTGALTLLWVLTGCSDTIWVESLPPKPWEDESESSGAGDASSSEAAAESQTESSDDDAESEEDESGDSTGEETREVLIEIRCEEDDANFNTNYAGYVFHRHDGETITTGSLAQYGVAECPVCPDTFALTIEFNDNTDFDPVYNTLTIAGLGDRDFYSFELCAASQDSLQTTPYGSATFSMPQAAVAEELEYRLYTGGAGSTALAPGAQYTRDYHWPSQALSHSGEVVGLAIAREPSTKEVLATSFATQAHLPTQTSFVELPPWETPLPLGHLSVGASTPRYIQQLTFHQGYRGVPLAANASMFTNIYPGAWTSPSDEHDYPYLLIPNSLATESYLSFVMIDAGLEQEFEVSQRRTASIVGTIDVVHLAPVFEEVGLPTAEDPTYRWSVDARGFDADGLLVTMSGCESFNHCWSLITPQASLGEVTLPGTENLPLPTATPVLYSGARLDYRDWAGWSSMVDGQIRLDANGGWGYVAPPLEGAWHQASAYAHLDE